MGVNRAGKHLSFHISTQAYVVLAALGVGHANDVLLDDGALIQIACHIMRCGTNQLDPAFKGLLVGICALEARQKRVVDIDNLA